MHSCNRTKAAVFALGATVAVNTAALAAVPSQTTLIAHRGESFDAPENTLPAYRTAVERGFGFECDIYLSMDGKLFTFHDNDLSRTTGGAHREACTEAAWTNLLENVNVGGWGKWKGSKFDPTRPALFSEVLSLARDGRFVYVEVKGDNPEWVPVIKAEMESAPNANPSNVLFIAFGQKVCAELKRQMPEYKTYWLATSRRSYLPPYNGAWSVQCPPRTVGEILEILARTGADGLDIQFDAAVVTPEFVSALHKAGYSVHVWTVDDVHAAEFAFECGADTVTTNRARSLMDEYERKVPAVQVH